MNSAFARVDLPDSSKDFQRIAVEPGVPLLDRAQSTGKLLRIWLGRLVAEAEWADANSIRFYLNDDEGRRVTGHEFRSIHAKDLSGRLRQDVEAIRAKLGAVVPRGRTEEKVLRLVRERFDELTRDPDRAVAEGCFFACRDGRGQWKLVWCAGYQRTESKRLLPVLCPKEDCRRVYLVRDPSDPKCPACQTPMPVFRFPWKKVGLMATAALLLAAAGGWWTWQKLPRSAISGQVVWSGFDVPVPTAEVRIDDLNVSVRSDANGRFRLGQLPAGEWNLTIKADGYQPWKRPQTLARAEEATVAVDLVGAGVLSGLVIDSESRKPIPNPGIEIDGTSRSFGGLEDGTFRAEGFRHGKLKVLVKAKGYPRIEHEVTLENENHPVEIPLTGDAILVGRVLAAATDQPMSGVVVTLEGCGQTARTDAEGWVAFRNAPSGTQRIVVEAENYATVETDKDLVSGQERQAQFKLSGAAKISGSVTRAVDGAPFVAAEVRIAGTRFSTRTDEEGKFQLQGVMAGKAALEVLAPGFATERMERMLSNSVETVLSVKLKGEGLVQGQVKDAVLQQPVADAEVRLVNTPHTTRTDADGKYRLAEVPAAPAKLEVRAAGYVARTLDVRPAAKPEATADIALSGNSSLEGIVVERWSDKPVPNASIRIGKSEVVLSANADGKFEWKGVRGGATYDLECKADGLASQSEKVEARTGQANAVRFVLTGTARQAGRVVSAVDESPVAGAKVQLHGTSLEVTTDEQGRFVLEKLRAGKAVLNVTASKFRPRRVEQAFSEDSPELNVLVGGDASVVGQVVDGVSRQPVANTEVRIEKTVLKAKTDAKGRYRIDGAFAGLATLTAQGAGYPAAEEQVELTAEGESDVDFSLTGTSSVTGEVFSDQGKPLENAVVRWSDSDHRVTTGPRGEFQLPMLPGGAIRLGVSAPMFARKTVTAEVEAGGSKSVGRIMLVSSLTLRGIALNALNEEPVADAAVSIVELDLKTISNEAGEFQFEGLPARRLTLRMEAAGYVVEQNVVNPGVDDERERFCLCPTPKADEAVIVLTWRNAASNLDAHLFRPSNGRPATQVSAAHPDADNLHVVRASTSPHGPETLRIQPLKPGRYELIVHRPPDEDDAKDPHKGLKLLSQSEAQVKVYRQGLSEPRIYTIGRNKQATTWQPFALEVIGSDRIIEHVYKAEHYRTELPAELRSR